MRKVALPVAASVHGDGELADEPVAGKSSTFAPQATAPANANVLATRTNEDVDMKLRGPARSFRLIDEFVSSFFRIVALAACGEHCLILGAPQSI